MKKHAGMKGVRLYVYKPDRKAFTTVYANDDTLADLLPYVDGDVKELSALARIASLRARARDDRPWGECVVGTLRSMLLRAAKEKAATEKAAAAANNAAWDAT